MTGRNEATLYKDASCSGEGILVFSKLNLKKQPTEDEETAKMFIEMVTSEFENLWSWKSFVYLIAIWMSASLMAFEYLMDHL